MGTTDIFVAKESFTVTLNGESIQVNQGRTRVRAGHPLLKGREMYFEPLTVQYDVETASARPGERRGEPAPVAVAPTPEPDPVKDEPVKAEPAKAAAAKASDAKDK